VFYLREYQELLIEGVRSEFDSGKKRVCIVSPCGSGKTVIMAWMSAQSKLRGNNVLFAVHRQELIKQSSDTFKDMGITHGIIAAGFPMNLNEKIQIASIQTVIRRLNKINAPQVIILDEAQHCLAGTWKKLLNAYPQAFVIGLTATPARTSGQGLGDIFESMVIGPSVKKLIAMKNLAPYKYYAPPVAANLDGIRVKLGDYDKSEVALRMDKSEIIGDIISHYQKFVSGGKAVCYCASVAHSQHTAEMFRKAGISALHIDGETPDISRQAAIEEFKAGKIKILCNVDLISEGYDCPSMDAVILARPTQSLVLFIQQAMRCMRADKHNPDKVAIIIDHVGNVYRHGLPDEDREWSLDGKKKKTGTARSTFPVRQCPKCYATNRPVAVCPECGYKYPVEDRADPEQKAGQLSEVINLERKAKRQEVGKARSVVTLEQIAMQRGYSPRWVKKMCEVKGIEFGVKPGGV